MDGNARLDLLANGGLVSSCDYSPPYRTGFYGAMDNALHFRYIVDVWQP
ncbi:MAG: hypothetical protein OXE94_01750 [Aestuariivita sp.]|nr:hypothetical protein [Aestuariivita sp.]MCY4203762.1 hypothetical protein [Aestuariivita sp.]